MATAPSLTRFVVEPQRSAVLIEARSNVGVIAFGAGGVEGSIDVGLVEDGIDPTGASAHVQLRVDRLESGNSLYDVELRRRIDARRYPRATAELREIIASAVGANRFHVRGDVTFHGVTRSLAGDVSIAMREDKSLLVTGEQDFDIREFDMGAPTMLVLTIQPTVRVRLHLEATPG